MGYSPWCCRVGPDVVTERYTRVRKKGNLDGLGESCWVALRHLQESQPHLEPLVDAKSRPSGGLHSSGHAGVQSASTKGVGRQRRTLSSLL